MKPFRVYVDSSVFGGCYDEEFAEESTRFFDLVRAGRVVALVSEVVAVELASAPPAVRNLLDSLPRGAIAPVSLTTEVIALREAYVAKGIVGPKSVNDATHVAAATAAHADAIVSWNFRHVVRLDKIRRYNAVNVEMGYGLLSIVTPQEVRFDEDD